MLNTEYKFEATIFLHFTRKEVYFNLNALHNNTHDRWRWLFVVRGSIISWYTMRASTMPGTWHNKTAATKIFPCNICRWYAQQDHQYFNVPPVVSRNISLGRRIKTPLHMFIYIYTFRLEKNVLSSGSCSGSFIHKKKN